MAPFPKIVLRVRLGWRQFIKNVVCTLHSTELSKNNRSSASSTSSWLSSQ